ncbi:MAG: MogA/MoaB family molybdenum cofactor biosynthesis protein, partial [Bacillota bacterium]|nr:MogA/MoaB family molybdenum cofactor biosynthesis protein [Bacillota bacterium]
MSYTAAVITVSDKGALGQRKDTSGPAVKAMLEQEGWQVGDVLLVPDEEEEIKAALLHCADGLKVNLVLTTGGTGFSRRDVTPEATEQVLLRPAPGFAEAMRAASLAITPRGMLSRGVSGIRNDTIIINLPGSEKAARENLSAVLGALKHAVDMLTG